MVTAFLCAFGAAVAQRGANWYFGEKAGISFATGAPKAISGSQMNTLEGCSAMSDLQGNLLFYTDGKTVWTASHNVMANGTGMLGGSSTSQSSIVLPMPCNDSLYYIFTAPPDAYVAFGAQGPKPCHYNVVNMRRNNGLGEVVTKNVLLNDSSSERLTAVQHANGKDYWVITNRMHSNLFRVYLLDENGLQPTPVINSVGTATIQDKVRGMMKVSPDGKYLMQTISETSYPSQLFKFNNATGVISDPVNIAFNASYGCAFSPDSKKLYLNNSFPTNATVAGRLAQFDITDYDSATIAQSKFLYTYPVRPLRGGMYDISLGPDGKLYIARWDAHFLSCIEKPNETAAASSFVDSAVYTGAAISKCGLPNFYNAINMPPVTVAAAPMDCYTYSFACTSVFCLGQATYSWTMGDGTVKNDSALTYTFSSEKDSVHVRFELHSANPVYDYYWSQWIVFKQRPMADFSFITNSCKGDIVQFTSGLTAPASHNWAFGDLTVSVETNPQKSYADTGTYTVSLVAKDSAGCISKPVKKTVRLYKIAKAGFDMSDSAVCQNTGISFTDKSTVNDGMITAWNWDFGNGGNSTVQNPDKKFTTAGTHTVSLWVVSAEGCVSDTAQKKVTVYLQPIVDAGDDLVAPAGKPVTLNASSNSNSFLLSWSPAGYLLNANVLQPTATLERDQLFHLTATGAGGCGATDSVWVKVFTDLHIPNAFSPNGDGLNDVWNIPGLSTYSQATLQVFNRWGQAIFQSKGYNKPWDGTFSGQQAPVGVYYYIISINGNGYGKLTGSVTVLR